MCGDWHRAEDLVQTCLTKLYVAWPRVRRKGTEDAYARAVLVRTCIDARRRAWNRERVVDTLPEPPAARADGGEDRDLLVAAWGPGGDLVEVTAHWGDGAEHDVTLDQLIALTLDDRVSIDGVFEAVPVG